MRSNGTNAVEENIQRTFEAIGEKLTLLRGHLNYEQGKERLSELESLAQDPNLWGDSERARTVMTEKNRLEKTIGEWDALNSESTDARDLLEMAQEEGDSGMIAEVTAQVAAILKRLEGLELARMLSGEADANNCFIEIHPGAGGTESQDWASILLRMYLRYCEKSGFKTEEVDYLAGDEAGIKSVTIKVEGDYAYGYLKVESGVHRLVRISPFDSSARRHTSFTSVNVYPEIDDSIEIEILDKDLRVDTFRASGAGGQHVNKTDSAIRITHQPTGIVVQCQSGRSQHRNRDEAMKMLRARLFQLEMDKRAEAAQAVADAKSDIAWGHQIRSYVLAPYRLVKDLRTSYETGNTDAVLDGELDGFIKAALSQRIVGDDHSG
ncbi:bacterial peptide chain release factor 2 (bRF-2) [Magnetococcus marinus MC-1]|uniref:Peptide chain release factor 2 n=1 Tax=Magnetococcus marinus (strain ATCC BAA-1437 / JCM 17883 / MC-1) TaxID=156889 RepID=A0L6F6_MAGMM|nr:peptide chain release factor 2 [Magnetococcus marinus]ABK43549.1 bacterial peptide chain release factor 2 (bRF-2) [Magnetococcus marinus MC-1]